MLVTAGEIDCREGIAAATASGKYGCWQDAVQATVEAYVTALDWLATCYDLRLLVMPVPPPPAHPDTQARRRHSALFNEVSKCRIVLLMNLS